MYIHYLCAQNVVWSFGLNRNVPVHNLTDGFRKAVVYASSHVAIMYDITTNTQHILQGHVSLTSKHVLQSFKSDVTCCRVT